MRSRPRSPGESQRGVTLLELLIAVSLVAVLSTGMLFAMRASVLAYEKTAQHLEANRRVVGVERVIASQLSGVMPVAAICPALSGLSAAVSFLAGTPGTLRLVSSYSIGEGARGYPQIVEYRVLPADGGGVRLVASEFPYSGPQSTAPYCLGTPPPGARVMVLADHLAYCRISYHEPYNTNTFEETPWLAVWDRPVLPGAVRIEMHPAAPVAGSLAPLDVTVPIRVTRDPLIPYVDRF
jgi:prepilin-type N-terminal cleavage/methylation domain-containing protein